MLFDTYITTLLYCQIHTSLEQNTLYTPYNYMYTYILDPLYYWLLGQYNIIKTMFRYYTYKYLYIVQSKWYTYLAPTTTCFLAMSNNSCEYDVTPSSENVLAVDITSTKKPNNKNYSHIKDRNNLEPTCLYTIIGDHFLYVFNQFRFILYFYVLIFINLFCLYFFSCRIRYPASGHRCCSLVVLLLFGLYFYYTYNIFFCWQ